jgi:hypothetical protein
VEDNTVLRRDFLSSVKVQQSGTVVVRVGRAVDTWVHDSVM